MIFYTVKQYLRAYPLYSKIFLLQIKIEARVNKWDELLAKWTVYDNVYFPEVLSKGIASRVCIWKNALWYSFCIHWNEYFIQYCDECFVT